MANALAALEAGLSRRAWELAMALSPVHASRFTFDNWSVPSELAVTAAEATGDAAALSAALDNRGNFLFRRRLLETLVPLPRFFSGLGFEGGEGDAWRLLSQAHRDNASDASAFRREAARMHRQLRPG